MFLSENTMPVFTTIHGLYTPIAYYVKTYTLVSHSHSMSPYHLTKNVIVVWSMIFQWQYNGSLKYISYEISATSHTSGNVHNQGPVQIVKNLNLNLSLVWLTGGIGDCWLCTAVALYMAAMPSNLKAPIPSNYDSSNHAPSNVWAVKIEFK